MNIRTFKNWDDLRFLVALHRTGTMAGAARYLGTNTATVSRRLDRLSATLGGPLLNRTRDGWQTTDFARRLIDVALGFDGRIQSELNAATEGLDEKIPVKLGCMPFINSAMLLPSLQKTPEVLAGLAVTFNDRITPGALGENDLVVSFTKPESTRLTARKLGEMTFNLYMPRGGTANKGWLGLSDMYDTHELMRRADAHFKTRPRHRASTFGSLYGLAKSLRMPAPLPDAMAKADADLVAIDTETFPLTLDCWVFFHETHSQDIAICRVVDWIEECFASLD
ncbi:LysR family transcriptional regulator [Rhodobacteraceae bacterium D3-12]|nr:LysR family transcriptional regulator [Rhodobacteraceae bacterium D3-12]